MATARDATHGSAGAPLAAGSARPPLGTATRPTFITTFSWYTF
jgi:hypothetical protein